jgi:hypothetical protein
MNWEERLERCYVANCTFSMHTYYVLPATNLAKALRI